MLSAPPLRHVDSRRSPATSSSCCESPRMLACHRAVLQPDRPGRTSCVSDGDAHAAGLDLRDRDRECAYLHTTSISLSLTTLTLYIVREENVFRGTLFSRGHGCFAGRGHVGHCCFAKRIFLTVRAPYTDWPRPNNPAPAAAARPPPKKVQNSHNLSHVVGCVCLLVHRRAERVRKFLACGHSGHRCFARWGHPPRTSVSPGGTKIIFFPNLYSLAE